MKKKPATCDEGAPGRAVAAFRRDFARLLPAEFAFIERHVAERQRLPLMESIVEFPDDHVDAIEAWLARPFAPWASMPAGFVSPR